MQPLTPSSVTPSPAVSPTKDTSELLEVAKSLEATFLAEMLKGAGLADGRKAFGGGMGEELFASQLADSYARQIVDRGGIGLAEAIFRSLGGDQDA